jgi:hypothetical protein
MAARRQIRQLAEHRLVGSFLTDHELTPERRASFDSPEVQAKVKDLLEKHGLHVLPVETVDWMASCFQCLLDDADKDEQDAHNANHRSQKDLGLKKVAENKLRAYQDEMYRGDVMAKGYHNEFVAAAEQASAEQARVIKVLEDCIATNDVVPRKQYDAAIAQLNEMSRRRS